MVHTSGKLFYSLTLGMTLAMRKSRSSKRRSVATCSKRRSVANKSPRNVKEPELVRCQRDHPDENECPQTFHEEHYERFFWSPGIALRLLCGVCSQSCPNKAANEEGRRWSQCHLPKQSKKAEFGWARCCWLATCASKGGTHMCGLHSSQPSIKLTFPLP